MKSKASAAPRPNIIYILADDLGYGDPQCQNPDSRIPTPQLDRLAGTGVRFTDAHAPSSVCTPSRYSILTGRYSWRSRLKRGIVWQWDGALIEPEHPTVASYLRAAGYHTACIGKWHLGWDWPTHDGRHPNESLPFGVLDHKTRAEFAAEHIRLDGRMGGGPVDRGFDSYFGVDVPNFPPYAWFEDDRLTEVPTTELPPELYGAPGPSVPDWSHEAMIPEFTRRAVDFIERDGSEREDRPFFLYFPLTSPHSPIVPNKEFLGRSGIGNYGDFVCEVDWVVGQIVDAVERAGLSENTLIVFTSDNGPEKWVPDDEGAFARARDKGHYSMGPWRGIKRAVWEGGHRVPLIASWPGTIPAGGICDRLVGLHDFFGTCAGLVGKTLPPAAAEDSASILPLLRNPSAPAVREAMVYHSATGKYALRTADWVFVAAACGGDNEEPDWWREARGYEPHDLPGELFDLASDPTERRNLYAERPDLVRDFSKQLREVLGDDSGESGAE